MKRISLMVIFLLGIAGVLALTTNNGLAAAPEEIRIGVTAPLTGPAAEAGVARALSFDMGGTTAKPSAFSPMRALPKITIVSSMPCSC